MGIRAQIAIFSGLILAVTLTLILYISNSFILEEFKKIEERGMNTDINRVSDALKMKLGELDRIAADWSAWDDTYRFVRDRNIAYIKSNLPDKSIASLDINLIMYFDEHNVPVYAKSVNIESMVETPLPKDIYEVITSSPALHHHNSLESGNQGILELQHGILMFASRPIITSERTGPARGCLVIGRFLDQKLIARIKSQTRLDFSLTGISGKHPSNRATNVYRPDESHVVGETLLSNLNGIPIKTLRVESLSDVYQQGKDAARLITLLFVTGSFVTVFALLLFADRSIIHHLVHMSSETDRIADSPQNVAELKISGGREFYQLGHAINRMLAALKGFNRIVEENEEKHHAILQHSHDAICIINTETLFIEEANPAFYRISGYEPDDLRTLRVDMLSVDNSLLPGMIDHLKEHGEMQDNNRKYRRKDGEVVEVDISACLISFAGKDKICLTARDMTERNREHRLIQEMAITDQLTGIPNRRQLISRGTQEFERTRRGWFKGVLKVSLGCIMIDIDHFKAINDSYGHLCGDKVLREFAGRVAVSVRPYDVVGRFGGEEFVVFLADSTVEQTQVVAERIWNAVRNRPFEIDNHVFNVTASFGISCYAPEDSSLNDLLKRADQALYRAKASGRDRIEQA